MTLHMTISSFQKQLTTQITDFLARKTISDSSKQAYAYDLKQFVNCLPGRVDQTSLKLYENQLKEWKPSVQKRKRSAVNQFLLYLYQKGELEEFFKLSETAPLPSQQEELERFDLSSLYEGQEGPGKLACLFILELGLLPSEILELKWEDIDMISRTLHVNRTVQRLPVDTIHTSGSSQNNHTATRKTSLYIDSPKTSNSLREIPISDFIYDKLSDYYNTSMKGDSYFLKKNQPMDPRTYQNKFHIYIREAGIGNTHFHALRHTFATNCISSGADAKSVSEILGHSNVNITLNRYVHPNLETKRSAINSIVIP